MTACQPFMPHYGSNQVLTASSTSAIAAIDPFNKQIRVTNSGEAKAYFRTFNSDNGDQDATDADAVIYPGTSFTLTKSETHNAIAYVSEDGTTLEVIAGEGF